MQLILTLLLLLPLAAAIINFALLLVRKATGAKFPAVEHWISVAASIGLFCLAIPCFLQGDEVSRILFEWIAVSVQGETVFSIPLSVDLNPLSKPMLLVVTGVGMLIHIFSLGYMKDDEARGRYFTGLSLFMFSMLGIVLADNLIAMFIFWELVGVSSYLLIGHWFIKPSAADAANKAFIVNRIGDFGFMIGILMLFVGTGSLAFDNIQAGLEGMAPAWLTAATLFIFCGAIGKSAQFPLHVWLPDAMEGPTPVSALIHAATMVAAGVYMMARLIFLVEAAPTAALVITIIGTLTAFLAAFMALEQDDIKRILAYSTLSQLGYMIAAIGLVSAYAALFHLITHAFFKALLFLGSGAVIYAMHHEQDIWKMGGLKKLPLTFYTFLAGTLALVGFPLFSGFFSKDAILYAAKDHNIAVLIVLLITAAMTAFYMTRLVVVTFLGKPRTEAAHHAREVSPVMWAPLVLLAIPSVIIGFPFLINNLLHLEHAKHEGFLIPILGTAVFVIGAGLAFWLYAGSEKQPYSIPFVSRAIRNRLYIDDGYSYLVKYTQDLLAKVSNFIDKYIFDLIFVRGAGAVTWSIGSLTRQFQTGNLQGYAVFFAVGVLVILVIAIF